ncbi:uncharacterized protein LOC126800984 [Argentina anserina]|uniref:uncharacterized protein LOC126800984 n=1 Tax=Argentina anserina TaxID=57926 RepID=UPI002176441E|nr:uncharacterized protein LOC126800984 [Potentilla anserina]
MAFSSSKSVLVSLLLVVFLVINIEPSLSQSTQQIIEKICRSTEDYGYCRKTFQAHLKAPNSDIVAITQITVEVAVDHATKTHQFIRQTLETTKDANLKRGLSECEEAYRLIVQAFDSAAVSFFQRDYDGVYKDERITPRVESSCEDTLATPPVSPQRHILDDRSKGMRIFIVMAMNAVQDLLNSRSEAPAAAPAAAPALL